MPEQIDLWKTDNEIIEILGSRLKSTRLQANISQAELAQETSLSLGTIQNFEAGKGPKLESLIRILRFFSELDKLDSILETNKLSPQEQFINKNETERKRARKKND